MNALGFPNGRPPFWPILRPPPGCFCTPACTPPRRARFAPAAARNQAAWWLKEVAKIVSIAERPAHADSTVEALLKLALDRLDDDQADNVVVVNLIGKSSIADYMVIASGRSVRHVGSMAEHLAFELRGAGVKNLGIEGMPQADWVVIDGRDVIIHLFRPDVRRFYNLEKMWGVDLPAAPARSGLDESEAGAAARIA